MVVPGMYIINTTEKMEMLQEGRKYKGNLCIIQDSKDMEGRMDEAGGMDNAGLKDSG
jgi:hypothetical protein